MCWPSLLDKKLDGCAALSPFTLLLPPAVGANTSEDVMFGACGLILTVMTVLVCCNLSANTTCFQYDWGSIRFCFLLHTSIYCRSVNSHHKYRLGHLLEWETKYVFGVSLCDKPCLYSMWPSAYINSLLVEWKTVFASAQFARLWYISVCSDDKVGNI